MSGSKHRLSVTLAQAVYLRDLVKSDIVETSLSISEQQQARSLLRKLNDLVHSNWEDSTFDPASTGQDKDGWKR